MDPIWIMIYKQPGKKQTKFHTILRHLKTCLSVNLVRFSGFFKCPPSSGIKPVKIVSNLSSRRYGERKIQEDSWHIVSTRNPKETSLFEGQPPKTRPKFQSKQGSFGFQVILLMLGYHL